MTITGPSHGKKIPGTRSVKNRLKHPEKSGAKKFSGLFDSGMKISSEKAGAQAIEFSSVSQKPAQVQRICDTVFNRIHSLETHTESLLQRLEAGNMDPRSVMAFQAEAYRMNQEIQLAVKLVEQLVSGVKTTLQTQV